MTRKSFIFSTMKFQNMRKHMINVVLFVTIFSFFGLFHYNYVYVIRSSDDLQFLRNKEIISSYKVAVDRLHLINHSTRKSVFNTSCQNQQLFPKNGTLVTDHINLVIHMKEIPCLKQFIDQECYDGKPVPNVIHYVWLGKQRKEMEFYQFLSVYSTHRFLHPCLILFHGETLPFGRYWDLLQTVVPNIVHVNITAPSEIKGIEIKHIEHKADIVRFEALRDYGGIYMDSDSVALKSMDSLRSYNFTLGIENPGNLAIATILSAQNPEFLRIWLEHYISFDPDKWGWHSIILPYRLSKKYPNLIHVEENYTFYYGGSGAKLISGKMNWSGHYAMHLSMRYYSSVPFNEIVIRKLDTTLGEIGRHILFGSKIKCV